MLLTVMSLTKGVIGKCRPPPEGMIFFSNKFVIAKNNAHFPTTLKYLMGMLRNSQKKELLLLCVCGKYNIQTINKIKKKSYMEGVIIQ